MSKQPQKMRFHIPEKQPNPLKLDKLRHYQVRTRNSLIQNTSFKLTTSQQKIILHLIQKISDKTKSLKFRFNVQDYENFLGISHDSRNTRDIKNSLQNLADKSFWIRTKNVNSDHPDDEYDDLIRWFSHVRYNRTRGYFEVEFDKRLKPFLLNIKTNFTSFDYHNVIGMRRSYSIRLYEILVSHYNQQNKYFGYKYSVNQLRFLLGIRHGKYKRFSDLNRRVIQPSLIEMNKKTNFNFYYHLIKSGRKAIGIRFLLKPKNDIQRQKAINSVDKTLIGKDYKKERLNQPMVLDKQDDSPSTKHAEELFKQDLKNAHRREAKKDKLNERREYLKNQEAKRRRHIKDKKHKDKRYARYHKKYNK